MLFTVFLLADFQRESVTTLVLKIQTKNPQIKKTLREKQFVERKNEGRKSEKT
jgi:hypothetical protein